MPGRDEDFRGVLDPDRMVQRRVKDKERLFQPPNSILDAVRTRVLDKLLSDKERAPGEIDVGLTVLVNLLEACSEVLNTWPTSAGAPMVATARTSGMAPPTARTAAPPSEWPISTAGAS
ncbi:hypothetical protein T190_30790 [Sinorhizobium meliloti CCBAU 01290]|nr:hypothetical protein T190_30790 [Sinorhizobium meliloti CCBAU 01290]